MKKQYTKKQITEAIAFWKKQLDKLNESGESIAVTSLQLDNVLDALGIFDACAMWPKATTQLKMPKDAINSVFAAFSSEYGKIKAVGVHIVISREQYEDEIEMHNGHPYEDYIDNEKYRLAEQFDIPIKEVFTPKDFILVDGIEVDFKKCSAFIVPYAI